MESKSLLNPSSYEEADLFLDATEEFYYDCFPIHYDSHRLNSSTSSSSTTSESFELSSTMEKIDELPLVAIEKDVDAIESGNSQIDPISERGENFEAIESCMDVTVSGQDRVDPFSTVLNTETTVNDDIVEDYAGPTSQLQEATSTDWSLTGLVIKSIEFQVSLMMGFISFPPWLIHTCLIFVSDPYRTVRRGRRYLLSKIVEFCDLGLKDDKRMLETLRRLAWGFFWAVYVGIVLFALLASAFMISGFVISHLAQEPLVIKESLNFDYTKSSPEAYVPITSCDSSFKESIETGKIRGLKITSPNHRTEITVSMTLPESEYNRNLGMFQLRVDFLSANGEILSSSRRPCMIRFRSDTIRLVQTFLKIFPLVTGYVSEIQTLNLKFKDFAEKDIVLTTCLKIMIEQRAEFRSGAGIPEIYDASLLLKSELPFLKRIIWNWRRTLFVWISMSLFIIELLFALVVFGFLMMPRTGQTTEQRRQNTFHPQ